MKNLNTYTIILFILILGTGSYFLLRTPKCSGDTCEIEPGSKEIFSEYKEMNPMTLENEVALKNIFLLDVREIEEWQDGHIKGASFLPLGEINKKSTADFPQDKPIYVYCRSGRRAGEAVEALESLGFKNTVNIGGVNHWIERGGSLVKF